MAGMANGSTILYVFSLNGVWTVGRGVDPNVDPDAEGCVTGLIEGLGVTGRGRNGKKAAIAAANTEAAKTGERVQVTK